MYIANGSFLTGKIDLVSILAWLAVHPSNYITFFFSVYFYRPEAHNEKTPTIRRMNRQHMLIVPRKLSGVMLLFSNQTVMCSKETITATGVIHLTTCTAWHWIKDELIYSQVRLYFVTFV